MTWLKENWFKVGILIVILFFFYWYSYRPQDIRSMCLAEAESNPSNASISSDRYRFEAIDLYYRNCLHRWGLEK